jgi:hypothetical protein
MQDFLNEKLFPIIDPELAQLCTITLAGFDAQSKQQETEQLKEDAPLHYDYDSLLSEVEKPIVGQEIGGKFPFNETFRQILDNYYLQSDVIEKFSNDPSAIVDPMLKYKRDQYFTQHLQNLANYNPEALFAFYASKDDVMDILKMYINDYLDEN